MLNRWVVYQRERFPVVAHAPLVAAFSLSALCLSSLLRDRNALPAARAALVVFSTAFLFFLQLRIADEFKDYDEDARWRPYRPVPHGLVSLRELGAIGAAAAVLQAALAVWLDPSLLALLAATWIYLWLMTREFFVPAWLKARPIAYMVSHMVIVPLIDLYATACDWWVAGLRRPPDGLVWFLLVSFFNGIVIEIGRKIRAPDDEEQGVETYSVLWGRTGAVTSWLGAMTATAVFAAAAASEIDVLRPVALLLATMLLGAIVAGLRFLAAPTTRRAQPFELISGVWTLFMYLSLGAAPLLVRVWAG